MLRITAGKFKNKVLEVADSARPLMDRMRLSIFDLLGDYIPNSNVLDLYAGSGVTGLEALSRGAKSCTFVDNDSYAIESIKRNIASCESIDNSEKLDTLVVKDNAKRFVSNPKYKDLFDLVFLDPPFDLIFKLDLNIIAPILKQNGLIIARLPKKIERRQIKCSKLENLYEKSYGKSKVVFYRPIL